MTSDPDLIGAINTAGLGPARSAEVRDVGTQTVLFIELDAICTHKARTLGR